jgi:hypothetical protein
MPTADKFQVDDIVTVYEKTEKIVAVCHVPVGTFYKLASSDTIWYPEPLIEVYTWPTQIMDSKLETKSELK